MRITALVSVGRSTDALSDARMVTEAGAWMLAQGLQVQVCADFLLNVFGYPPPPLEDLT